MNDNKENITIKVNSDHESKKGGYKNCCSTAVIAAKNLFNTSVTPNSEEHSAIKIPTINAYLTNGY